MLIVNKEKVICDYKTPLEVICDFGLVTGNAFDLLLKNLKICPKEAKGLLLEVFEKSIETMMKESLTNE